jgi:hypothetical protein
MTRVEPITPPSKFVPALDFTKFVADAARPEFFPSMVCNIRVEVAGVAVSTSR